MVDHMSDLLLSVFKPIADGFGTDMASALSGGYDSRLMIACLKKFDVVPYIFVYGSKSSPDVKNALILGAGEGIPVDHIDKAELPGVEISEFPDVTYRNFLHYDGLGVNGIFNNGSDLDTRFERVSKGRLQMNGGGGGHFRNVWHLSSKHIRSARFTRHIYDIQDYSFMSSQFERSAYLKNLTCKIETAVGNTSKFLSSSEMEMVLPLFRVKYWQGINNSINARISPSITPLIDPRLLLPSYFLPAQFKNNGRFEGALIRKIDAQWQATHQTMAIPLARTFR